VTRPLEHAEELEMTQIARRDVLRAGAGGAAVLAVGLPQAAIGGRRRSDHGAGTIIEWNRMLLGILRTRGAHPATVHPTAVRLADSDGNRRTTTDPAWNPLAATPPDPSYPGAHSAVSEAGAWFVVAARAGSRIARSAA
jgi:hypothetical protein